MANLFYKYEVYDHYGVEHTCLKWLENSFIGEGRSVNKPTSELTAEDLAMIQEFIDAGSVIQDKTEAVVP